MLFFFSKLHIILGEVARADGTHKCFVHVKVCPYLGAGLAVALKSSFHLCLLNLFIRDRVINYARFRKIRLRQHEHHRGSWLNILDLQLPIIYVFEGILRVDRHADHKYVGIFELRRTVHAQMLISAGVVDLNHDLGFLDVFDALVDVKHRRLVVIREAILQVVANEAGFADRGVADEHDFYLLRCVRIELSVLLLFLFVSGL